MTVDTEGRHIVNLIKECKGACTDFLFGEEVYFPHLLVFLL
jgi:hypothetical protein